MKAFAHHTLTIFSVITYYENGTAINTSTLATVVLLLLALPKNSYINQHELISTNNTIAKKCLPLL